MRDRKQYYYTHLVSWQFKCLFTFIQLSEFDSIKKMSNLLFVYGTIKTGQPNHFMLQDAGSKRHYRLIGTGKTEPKWPLVIASKYNIPYLLDYEGEGHNVQGEVYELDDDLLAHVDDKEGCPDCYDRRKVRIVMDKMADGSKPKTIECWFYLLPRHRPSLLSLERHECYDSNGAHGKKYVVVYDIQKDEWIDDKDVIQKEIALLHTIEEQ